MYKNFDRMRMIMFNPKSSKGGSVKSEHMRRSTSVMQMKPSGLGNFRSRGAGKNLISSCHENMDNVDTNHMDGASVSAQSKVEDNLEFSNFAQSELNLDYLDELELNRAFSIFKDI